ncbi:hypothetical protein KBY97_05380 [Synechococcus sp. ATX 2A4]|uniref:hypothetical protein n=1 Tax=Synechococcus sp. ATX 2A4 TaxID=2823727 RepID=UPI0020CCB278|nr:hypothetical protein [Synechococcus sp. ATX 2A4]MCP9884556.1 hypothetical protein [Synechococcus sp. ATX 2A4]
MSPSAAAWSLAFPVPAMIDPVAAAEMVPEDRRRPAWLNWLFLLAFLWSSWQLAGLWLARLN